MAQQQKQTKQRQTEEVQARKNSILESLLDLAFQVAKNNHDYQIAEQKLKGELTWESWETKEGLEKWIKELEEKLQTIERE